MDVIKYYFIVVIIIATAFTIWDKCIKKTGDKAPEDKEDKEQEDKKL